MEEKRTYKKRSDYWGKFEKSKANSIEAFYKEDSVFEPSMSGESLYQSVATSSTSYSSSSRTNKAATGASKDRFKNISDGLLPFQYSADGVSVKEALELSQKAYFNIPVYRSTIDLMSEFADAEVYLEGGSASSKKFIKAWFNRINIRDLKSQFFREYYRSGNIFLYRIDGKTNLEQSKKFMEAYAATSTASFIPIKYMLLNPVDIEYQGTLSFTERSYAKMLTPYEISKLTSPKNDHEKELLESLPQELKDQINKKQSTFNRNLFFTLNPLLLHTVFSKKQDYEPFSIPMGFAVLDDINKKLELKKIDQAIARSIENVVLLVTMGAEPDKGGINHKSLAAMQNIFKNQSVGRVLVADYTTKAEFVIPDLRKVMGKEKYEILNKDIEEGLQNVLLGESKYADTQLKLKIFMQRLEEARNVFISEFLQPEIKRVCLSLGMKNMPQAKFVKTDTLDNSDLQKLVIRMMELGILTPEQGLKTINTGVFASEEDLVKAQEKFYEEREKGYWTPLVNSIQIQEAESNEKQQKFDNDLALKQQKTSEKVAMKPTPAPVAAGKPVEAKPKAKVGKTASTSGPSGGRPIGTSKASFSAKKISETVKLINEFEIKAFEKFAMKYGVDELTESKKDLVNQVCSSIIESSEKEEWDSILEAAVEDFTVLADKIACEDVVKISEEHQLDDFSSAILYHSTKF